MHQHIQTCTLTLILSLAPVYLSFAEQTIKNDFCAVNPTICVEYRKVLSSANTDTLNSLTFLNAKIDTTRDLVVPLCKVDPAACGLASLDFGKYKSGDGLWMASISNNPLFQPAPICQIDRCACQDCRKVVKVGFSGFESSASTSKITTINYKNRIGVEIISKPSPSFGYKGLFFRETAPGELSHGTISFKLDRKSAFEQSKYNQHSNIVCNKNMKRPKEFWRELLLKQNDMLNCSKAALAMAHKRETSPTPYFEVLAGNKDLKELYSTLPIFEQYDRACLSRVSDLNVSTPLKQSLGNNFIEHLKENVGTLTPTGKNIHCTASIIRQEIGSRTKIGLATAAHCVGEPTYGAGQGKLQYGKIYPNMVFTSFSGNKYSVEIDKNLVGYSYTQKQDLVVIPIKENPTMDIGFLSTTTPKIWDPLYIVGANPFLFALNKMSSNQPLAALGMASISFEPGCRVYSIDGPELRHNCQTEKSMSGSPIFVSENGEAKIVAVHSGATPSLIADSCEQSGAGSLNWGVLVR